MSPRFEKNLKSGLSQEDLFSLQSQLVQNGEDKFQLLPIEASIFRLSLQGFEHTRVTIRLGRYSKALHERLEVPSANEDTTSTMSSNEESFQLAVEKVADELASVDLFERLLTEYLRTRNSIQAFDVAKSLSLHGELSSSAARQIVASGILRGEMQPWLELPEEEQLYSLCRVLYLSIGEQECLFEALQITRESRKLAEFIREQREWSQEQEASVQMLVNQIRQFDQQRQLQNREKYQLNAKIQWLTVGLGIATVLGALGTFYGLFLD
jgi:hypothetical protein